MFENPCLGELAFGATSGAIAMGGIFLAFIVEYIGDRILQLRANKAPADVEISPASGAKDEAGSNLSDQHVHTHVHTHSHGAHSHGPVVNDKLSVLVMEAGIIFHSICMIP